MSGGGGNVNKAGVRIKQRGSGKATTPGRRVRRQIEVVRQEDAERALRLKRRPNLLQELEAQRVTELLADDAVEGKVSSFRLMLKILGIFGRG